MQISETKSPSDKSDHLFIFIAATTTTKKFTIKMSYGEILRMTILSLSQPTRDNVYLRVSQQRSHGMFPKETVQ